MSKIVTPFTAVWITLLVISTLTSFGFDPPVDTFEAGFDPLPNPSIGGENGWTAVIDVGLLDDPAHAGNTVMEVRDTTGDDTFKTIPTILNGTNSTIYFRFRINGGAPDISVGVSDSSTPNSTAEQRALVRINNTALQIPAWTTLSNLTADVWYQLWIVANSPSDDRFEVYIAKEGSDTPVQLSDGSNTDFPFRNGAAGELISFFVNCNTANGMPGVSTLIDDIYVDPDSKNLADPRVAVTQPYLVYSGTTFSESAPNNGQVSDPIDITLVNDTFYTNSPLQVGTHYTVSGVPDGMAFNLAIVSSNELSATLIGTANSHAAEDSTSMTFAFLDDAFVGSNAADVDGFQQEFAVFFDDPTPIGWQVIDNLESLGPLTNAVPLDGTNGWASDYLTIVALDDGSSNNVAQVRGFGSSEGDVTLTGSIALKPSGKIHSGTNGTLFFRFRLQNTFSADINLGLTGGGSNEIFNLNPTDQASSFGPIVRIVDNDLLVLNDANTTWKNIASNLVADTWYHLWMTIDNPNDSWQAYISGGVYTNQTQLGFDDGGGGEDTTFIFRSQTGDTPLINLMTRGNGANGTTASVWLDDIYIDLREWNLRDPLTPGGTMIMIL